MTTGSLVNLMMTNTAEKNAEPKPEVGMGATIVMWTDRHAATVIEVSKSGKTIRIREDHAERTDKNGRSDAQSWSFTPNENGRTYTVRLTKRGWKVSGGGPSVVLGVRSEYYDFSF